MRQDRPHKTEVQQIPKPGHPQGYAGGKRPPVRAGRTRALQIFFRKDAQETKQFWVERLGVEGGRRLCPLLQNFLDHFNFITNAYVSFTF